MLAYNAILYVLYIVYVTTDLTVLNGLCAHFFYSCITMCFFIYLHYPCLTKQN